LAHPTRPAIPEGIPAAIPLRGLEHQPRPLALDPFEIALQRPIHVREGEAFFLRHALLQRRERIGDGGQSHAVHTDGFEPRAHADVLAGSSVYPS
jgi:hypothetical protein